MIKSRVNLDEVGQEDEQEKSGDERQSEAGSDKPQSDYDVDEEYDNDYAENYFDNGEGDDADNLGDGGMGDDGGGAGKFSIFKLAHRPTLPSCRLRPIDVKFRSQCFMDAPITRLYIVRDG